MTNLDPAALGAAKMATLAGAASSPEATALIVSLAEHIEAHERAHGVRQRSRKVAYRASLHRALAALLADLIEASRRVQEAGFVYRSMQAKGFSGGPVTYRSFVAIVEYLAALGFIERLGGFRDDPARPFGGNSNGPVTNRKAARFRATPSLLDMIKAHGIDPANLSEHFAFTPPDHSARPLLALKTSSSRYGYVKVRGSDMPVPRTAGTKALADEVRTINDFLGTVTIVGASFHGLYRSFVMGDLPNYRWDKGGRLYAYGDSYQTAKKAIRLAMTLNGDPVVEIDIKASHLTVLHALLGKPLEIGEDAYEGLGVDREVAKAWLTATLGKGAPVTRWSKAATDEHFKRTGRKLTDDHKASQVGAKVMARYPLLLRLEDTGISWADLTFKESEAMVGAVLELIGQRIPALPVHDSLVVPAKDEAAASAVLAYHFERVVGVRPRLKVSGSAPSPATGCPKR